MKQKNEHKSEILDYLLTASKINFENDGRLMPAAFIFSKKLDANGEAIAGSHGAKIIGLPLDAMSSVENLTKETKRIHREIESLSMQDRHVYYAAVISDGWRPVGDAAQVKTLLKKYGYVIARWPEEYRQRALIVYLEEFGQRPEVYERGIDMYTNRLEEAVHRISSKQPLILFPPVN